VAGCGRTKRYRTTSSEVFPAGLVFVRSGSASTDSKKQGVCVRLYTPGFGERVQAVKENASLGGEGHSPFLAR